MLRDHQIAVLRSILSVFFFAAIFSRAALLPAAETPSDAETRSRLETLLSAEPAEPASEPIVATEQTSGRILLLRPNTDWNRPESLVWEWNPAESPAIVPEHRAWFSHPSDAKPVDGTKKLLTVASGGGVALINLADKKVLFYALAGGNTHSAALLPDGNIVTASSTGNYLKLFVVPDEFPGAEKIESVEYPFADAHGLVWDAPNRTLWALGGKEIAGYRYSGSKEKPSLERIFSTELPPLLLNGHDLCPIQGANALFVTGTDGIGFFETESRTLAPFSEVKHIKSISLDNTGHLIVQQPKEKWWSDSILTFHKEQKPIGTLDGARFYKARWWIADPLAAGGVSSR